MSFPVVLIFYFFSFFSKKYKSAVNIVYMDDFQSSLHTNTSVSSDFSEVFSSARIALYDDLKSTPRTIDISPNNTKDFIDNLSQTVYEEARFFGGKIPYTVIREVAENCIHARFQEIVVSVLDNGNTIKFSDQGPGINKKEDVFEPGITSATQDMKKYIRGVGSGFPYIKEYMEVSKGTVYIEDNVSCGSVITISLIQKNPTQRTQNIKDMLTNKQFKVLDFIGSQPFTRVSDVAQEFSLPVSSVYKIFSALEDLNLIEKNQNKTRTITLLGKQILS